MAKGGKREGAGRKEGAVGRKTLEAIGIITEKGCDPLGILCDIAMGETLKCGIVTLAGYSEVDVKPTLEQRKDAAKELCNYIYPKRKAVEHSGSIASHEDALSQLAGQDDPA